MLDLIRGRKTFAMMIDCCWVVGRGGRLVVVVCGLWSLRAVLVWG
jgi:hypothetical protein